jgi:hypothetical protein
VSAEELEAAETGRFARVSSRAYLSVRSRKSSLARAHSSAATPNGKGRRMTRSRSLRARTHDTMSED